MELSLSLPDALALCTALRSVSSSIRANLSKRLAAQRSSDSSSASASAASEPRSIDKSGVEIQTEAMQVALLTQGLPSDERTRAAVLEALRRHEAEPAVASFLHYWSSLGLVAGVYAVGSGGEVQTAFVDWYRGPPGQARYLPSLAAVRADLESFVLQGWAPATPPLRRRDSMTTALGSCFADEIRIWLRARGYRVNGDFRTGHRYPHAEDSSVPLLQCSAGLVNTFVLLQQFEWAFEARAFDDDLWHGAKGAVVTPTEEARLKTRELFEQTSLFIITLGLAEVWFQRRRPRAAATRAEAEADGAQEAGGGAAGGETECDVLWRAVPSHVYDPGRHGFRVSSVAENVANLRRIVRLIREHVPSASIVFTLSPVPLAATFRGVSCVTANSASKAILRAAVDELLREVHGGGERGGGGGGGGGGEGGCAGGLYYWPAFEMIKEGFTEPYLEDGRHPKPEVIQQILALFGKHYLGGEEEAGGVPDPEDT